MANQRKKGTRLAGAYISGEKDEALAALAERAGFPNKAAYLRALFDAALKEEVKLEAKEVAEES